MSKPRPTPEELAVRAGYWRVTFPGWLLMMAFFFSPILYFGVHDAFNTTRGMKVVGTFMVSGFAVSWLWWSISAPRWRLWAYERVNDIEHLEQLAVADNLIWPTSHPLSRTEWRFGAIGRRLKAFESRGAGTSDPPQNR